MKKSSPNLGWQQLCLPLQSLDSLEAAEQARRQPEIRSSELTLIAVAIRAVKADYPNKFVSEEDDHSR